MVKDKPPKVWKRFSPNHKIHRGGMYGVVNRVICGQKDPANSTTDEDVVNCWRCLRIMGVEK